MSKIDEIRAMVKERRRITTVTERDLALDAIDYLLNEIVHLTARNMEQKEEIEWLKESSKIIEDKAKAVATENKQLHKELDDTIADVIKVVTGAGDRCSICKGDCSKTDIDDCFEYRRLEDEKTSEKVQNSMAKLLKIE